MGIEQAMARKYTIQSVKKKLLPRVPPPLTQPVEQIQGLVIDPDIDLSASHRAPRWYQEPPWYQLHGPLVSARTTPV
jgi:hypothetical protein